MRPGRYAPDNQRAELQFRAAVDASMRPGRYAPDNGETYQGLFARVAASMRPGRYAPDNNLDTVGEEGEYKLQ